MFPNPAVIALHWFINFFLSVKITHLLYIFFCPFIVMFINCTTPLFFAACPSSKSLLNPLNDLLSVLSINPLNPFSNLAALFLASLSPASGRLFINLNASATLPALDMSNRLKNLRWISCILFISAARPLQLSNALFILFSDALNNLLAHST